MFMRIIPWLAAASVLACGSSQVLDHSNGGSTGVAEGDLEIYVAGDLAPKSLDDGLAGQTPEVLKMGLGAYQLMRSATDPAPVTVFRYAPGHDVEADLLGRTLVGRGTMADLPVATYTHGRTRLTRTRTTVSATVHVNGVAIAGKLTVVGVYACDGCGDSYTDPETGTRLQPGQAAFTFRAGGVTQTQVGALPPLPSTAGGQVVVDASGTWLVFPFPLPFTPPRPAHVETDGDRCEATIVYDVASSFRWRDESRAGYAAGTFDVDPFAATYEPVLNFGATGYRIEFLERLP